MAIVAKEPAAELFGLEVADDISKHKSLLKQCTEALETQSPAIPVVIPGTFQTPELESPNLISGSGTPYAVEIQWIKNLQEAMTGAAITITPPEFVGQENDNQSVFIAKWAKALFDSLRTAGYIA